MIIRSLLRALLSFAVASVPALACDGYATRVSSENHLQPKSVQVGRLADALNASPYSSGIQFASSIKRGDLLLDITSYPQQAPELGTIRALMQIGRLVDDGFEQLVLVDNGRPLFTVSREKLRQVGCRFNWSKNTGDNPLLLMTEMVASLRRANTGEVLVAGSSAAPHQVVAIVLNEINPLWAAPGNEQPQQLLEEEDLQLAALDQSLLAR